MWSPDGAFVGGVRYVSSGGTAPDDPDTTRTRPGTSCDDQVFALPADARDLPLGGVTLDPTTGVAVAGADGAPRPLTTCGGFASWLPRAP